MRVGPGSDGFDDECILEPVHLGNVLRIGWIDQGSHIDHHEWSVEFVNGQVVGACSGEDTVDVVILVGDHRRHVTVAGIRHR